MCSGKIREKILFDVSKQNFIVMKKKRHKLRTHQAYKNNLKRNSSF